MVKYHLKYKHLNPKAIKSVRECIKGGVFKAVTQNERLSLLDKLLTELSLVYNVPKPIIKIEEGTDGYLDIDTNSLAVSPTTNAIVLNSKLSLVTLLHEFKHYNQILKGLTNTEGIARGWSLSAYYTATPKLFASAVSKGLIIHETIADL